MLRSRQETLTDFICDQMAWRGIHTHAELAEFLGVSKATAGRLLRDPRVPHEDTLVKIARATGVPITEVREIANRPVGELGPFVLPKECDQLTQSQRDALVRIAREMLLAGGHPRVTRS